LGQRQMGKARQQGRGAHKGPHGVGLAKNIPGTSEWPAACQRWLVNLGVLNK
jgi:hypothetical protein